MLRLGESRVGVIYRALCEYFGIDQTGKVIPTLEKIICNRLTAEAKLHEISSQQLVRDIVDDYLTRQPTLQARAPEEIDEEIEERINELISGYNNSRPHIKKSHTRQIKNRILHHRLHVSACNSSRNIFEEALDRRAKLVGRTREEIERYLICAYFGIK